MSCCSTQLQTDAVRPALCDTQGVRQIEEELNAFTFCGVPVGSVVASLLHDEIWRGTGDWSVRGEILNRGRFLYHWLGAGASRRAPDAREGLCEGRVLVTCSGASRRLLDLVEPMARRLGGGACAVLCADEATRAAWPDEYERFTWDELAGPYDGAAWRRAFAPLWRTLGPALRQGVRRWRLPARAVPRFAAAVVLGTQRVARAQALLRRVRVKAVLADHDRFFLWAPLILSARACGVPTFSLMHGTFGERCAGYYPVLADVLFCWGALQRDMLTAAGAAGEGLVVAGCPRLTRELPLTAEAARAKLGLEPSRPVATLATAPYKLPLRLKLAEAFGAAMARLGGAWTGVVRLHSSERLEAYAQVQSRYPALRFLANAEASLDDMLAATDVAVVHSSGFGSDALVKSRLTVILDVIELPLGHGRELLEHAGCPRAASASELAALLTRLASDTAERARLREAAERYVLRFCAYYGEEAATRIASRVTQSKSKESSCF
jgi:hypothetical protein